MITRDGTTVDSIKGIHCTCQVEQSRLVDKYSDSSV